MSGALGQAAMTLIGTPFRLHGRDPVTGLDCVGLVAEAMRRSGFTPAIPFGYAMRSRSQDALLPFAAASGLVPVDTDAEADVVLASVNPVQAHLLVVADGGFVHAHAGLGRVTFHPGVLGWPVARRWRLAPIRS